MFSGCTVVFAPATPDVTQQRHQVGGKPRAVAQGRSGDTRTQTAPQCRQTRQVARQTYGQRHVVLAVHRDGDGVLGDVDRIEEGQTVKATGNILSMPVFKDATGNFVGERSFGDNEVFDYGFNIMPRLGVSYDLFGNSRTALKASIGKLCPP